MCTASAASAAPGADGTAVNLVRLDEEGFMQSIERFTKQDIPVQIVEGFMPEPGEKAEPIAMGRQTIWGGAGKPPSRDVMQAAAKAARSPSQRPAQGRGGYGGGNSAGNGGGYGGTGVAPAAATARADLAVHAALSTAKRYSALVALITDASRAREPSARPRYRARRQRFADRPRPTLGAAVP